ncbi:MAG: hypothetical protein LW855_00005 [Alphaproteobacteria bacterium]|jgi:hypothetical protein|nr:hypothetical protein [Alphaproteobacteria bacterium]
MTGREDLYAQSCNDAIAAADLFVAYADASSNYTTPIARSHWNIIIFSLLLRSISGAIELHNLIEADKRYKNRLHEICPESYKGTANL